MDETMTTTTKNATSRKPADKKTTAKEQPVNGQHRADVLKELSTLGWDGPTSYTLSILRDELLPWVAAGKPSDAPTVPAGAMNHAHPKAKAAKARTLSKGYLAALADVLAVLDQSGDVRAFVVEGLAA